MSLILKSENNREVEIPRSISPIMRELGIDETNTKEHVIDILNQSKMHLIALGRSDEYRKVKEAIDEVETWNGTIYADF